MIDNVIKINIRKSDLVDFGESIFLSSYQKRKTDTINYIIESRGYPPSNSMVYAREIVFPVSDKINIQDLLVLSSEIKDKFVIDCFQISIDRTAGTAHMLFDWYDRKKQKCVWLYPSLAQSLSAMFIQRLNIDVGYKDNQDIRFRLLAEYTHDPNVFDKVDKWVQHQKPGMFYYRIIKQALVYAKLKCQGLTK